MARSREITILYGSQTGTAQDLAESIGREAQRFHFMVKISAMDDMDISSLQNQNLVVFVCSTTGQGVEPDNMKKFWRFLLRKNLPSNSLSYMSIGVCGLGDSSYSKFNFAAKKLYRRLLQLGAHPLLPLALGDDQHDLGPDAAINPWLEAFWPKALEMFPLPEGLQPLSPNYLLPPKFEVEIAIDLPEIVQDGKRGESYSSVNPYYSSVVSNFKKTAEDHFQDVRLVTFDLGDSGLTYSPGDVVMIQPQNLDEKVEQFFKIFEHLDRDQKLVLSANGEAKLPCTWLLKQPFTLYECVKRYWDLQTIPRRSFFELLAKFSTDELEKEKLTELSASAGQQELYDYVNRPRRTLLEVFSDFWKTAAAVPLPYLFDLIPAIKPRAFSIASSARIDPKRLQILVAVVEYKTKLSVPRRGLCSTWISRLQPADTVPLWIRSGTLAFPSDPDTPVIMVGPGTGCAPFRSYIDDQLANGSPSQRDLCLFFGCRSETKDFFFAETWLAYRDQGRLRLFTAFSRDQEDKIYVQHRMKESASLLRHLILEKGARLYVAGNAKLMPDQVRETLADILGDSSSNDMASMEQQGRVQFETWS